MKKAGTGGDNIVPASFLEGAHAKLFVKAMTAEGLDENDKALLLRALQGSREEQLLARAVVSWEDFYDVLRHMPMVEPRDGQFYAVSLKLIAEAYSAFTVAAREPGHPNLGNAVDGLEAATLKFCRMLTKHHAREGVKAAEDRASGAQARVAKHREENRHKEQDVKAYAREKRLNGWSRKETIMRGAHKFKITKPLFVEFAGKELRPSQRAAKKTGSPSR